MKIQTALVTAILALWLSACAQSDKVLATGSPGPQITQTASPFEEEPSPSPAPATEIRPVVETAVLETQVEESSATPIPTLTEWEQVQHTIESYRNRLERNSDGYQGLTTALEQTEPNPDWCGGLNAAIGDFAYVNDEESVQALRDLQDAQGC
jgi:hypothetical protein